MVSGGMQRGCWTRKKRKKSAEMVILLFAPAAPASDVIPVLIGIQFETSWRRKCFAFKRRRKTTCSRRPSIKIWIFIGNLSPITQSNHVINCLSQSTQLECESWNWSLRNHFNNHFWSHTCCLIFPKRSAGLSISGVHARTIFNHRVTATGEAKVGKNVLQLRSTNC